jgi:hypothetical protein
MREPEWFEHRIFRWSVPEGNHAGSR